jgi:serine/threonine protein phosphatase PrpC
VTIRAHGISEAGTVRKNNEDKFVMDEQVNLYAVADGMGGHRAGEVASLMAIEAIAGFVRRSAGDIDFTWPFGIDAALSLDGNRLRTAIHLANRRIFQASETTEDYSGMGTTIVAVLVNGPTIAVAHVGDSRLYLFSEGTLQPVTEDDSWAATVLRHDPTMTADQVARHPMRNVLTNVLGAREQVDVHITERPFGPGDVLLLCSDGLHSVLEPTAIVQMLTAPPLEAAASKLVAAAMAAGSRDNVTAVVVRSDAA